LGLKLDDDIKSKIDSYFKIVELQLYYDEESNPVPLSDENVSILGMLNDFEYSQRIVADRISNPHGEHAEDMWTTNLILSDLSNLNESTLMRPKDLQLISQYIDVCDSDIGHYVMFCHNDLHGTDTNSILYLRNVG